MVSAGGWKKEGGSSPRGGVIGDTQKNRARKSFLSRKKEALLEVVKGKGHYKLSGSMREYENTLRRSGNDQEAGSS